VHLFFAFAFVLGIIQGFNFYPLLHGQIAVHFGAIDIADGWGAKKWLFPDHGDRIRFSDNPSLGSASCSSAGAGFPDQRIGRISYIPLLKSAVKNSD
jgi:hypothetical protein